MKKIFYVVFSALLVFSCCACSTNSTKSYELGEKGQYVQSYSFHGSKADIKTCAKIALERKGYNVFEEGDGIRAQLNHGGISANLFYTFSDNKLTVDARGSVADDRPLVPLNWILQANKLIKKELETRVK